MKNLQLLFSKRDAIAKKYGYSGATAEFSAMVREILDGACDWDADFEAVQAQAAPDSIGVDWLGLALDLESRAKTVESQTTERAMTAAAHGLRLMGGGAPAAPALQVGAGERELFEAWATHINTERHPHRPDDYYHPNANNAWAAWQAARGAAAVQAPAAGQQAEGVRHGHP